MHSLRACTAEMEAHVASALDWQLLDVAPKSFKNLAALTWLEGGASLYPLHPTLLPVLVRFFARFGQPERFLFGFLLSNELSGCSFSPSQPFRPTDGTDCPISLTTCVRSTDTG
jgi:hypothetical protein